MDFKQIQELIKMVNKSNIGELSIEQKDFKVTIKQKEEHVTHMVSAAPVHAAPVAIAAPAPVAAAPAAAADGSKTAPAAPSNTITIKSPMIGTAGTVVCIIEAMKLFNEIESEVKGRIVKVLVDDASPVEYDQPLFLVEPA